MVIGSALYINLNLLKFMAVKTAAPEFSNALELRYNLESTTNIWIGKMFMRNNTYTYVIFVNPIYFYYAVQIIQT